MSTLLPIIEDLANAPHDRARVGWLLKCPLGILLKYRMTIVNRLRMAGFLPGVAYVEALCVAMAAVRHDGALESALLHARYALEHDAAKRHARTVAAETMEAVSRIDAGVTPGMDAQEARSAEGATGRQE